MEPIRVTKFMLGAYNAAQIKHALNCPINTHGAAVRFSLPHEMLTVEMKLQQWTDTDGKDWWRRHKKCQFCQKVVIFCYEPFELEYEEDIPSKLDRVAS